MARLFRQVYVTKAVLVEGDPLDPSEHDWIHIRGSLLPGISANEAITWGFRASEGKQVSGVFTRQEIEAEQRIVS